MHRQALIALAVCITSFAYLSLCFMASPVNIESDAQLSLLQDNTIVHIDSAHVKSVKVMYSAKYGVVSDGNNASIIGYKTHYLNRTWVQALRIHYDR